MKIRNSLYLLFCIIVLASCKTVPKQKPVSEAPETPSGQNLSVSAEEDSTPAFGSEKNDREEIRHNLTLLFAGDIMAHKPNYSMSDYSVIWKDIAPLALSCDFSFANIEAPVDDSIPYATYPRFNMHSEYRSFRIF